MKLTSKYMAAAAKFGSDQRETIVVYVESYDDQRLWSNILKNSVISDKNIKLKFKVPSLSSEANGKNSLIGSFKSGSLVPGKNLIICLDSDFDYAFGCSEGTVKKQLYSNDFVFQTYVHSSENHYYTTNGLEHICEMAACSSLNINFCIVQYTKSWSEILFSLYTKILFLRKVGEHEKYRTHLDKVNDLLENTYSGRINVAKLGVILSRIEKEIDKITEEIDNNYNFDSEYISFVQDLKTKDFDQYNLNYLFRGHDLENKFLSNICLSLCNAMITNRKKEIYQANVGTKARQQIDEYQNKVENVVNAIKQRTNFIGNQFFIKVCNEFKSICEVHFK